MTSLGHILVTLYDMVIVTVTSHMMHKRMMSYNV